MSMLPETARANLSRIHSVRNANTGSNTAVSFDVSPNTVPNTMPETASAKPQRSRRVLSAVSIIQRPCRYAHNPASTNIWHRLSIRCTTYNTAIRLIGSSIHAALTISASRIAAVSSITALFPSLIGRGCPAGGEGSVPRVIGSDARSELLPPALLPVGEGRSTRWRHPTSRNSVRSMQNTSTPLIRWITMLVTLNGQGSPLPKYQLTENVSEANGRRRKLEGDDSAEFTHATSVECPRVIWTAALSTMFG